jgi:hypothetical protein
VQQRQCLSGTKKLAWSGTRPGNDSREILRSAGKAANAQDATLAWISEESLYRDCGVPVPPNGGG